MVKCHIESKWYASASDLELLPENKRNRYLMNIDLQDKAKFVNLPQRLPGSSPLNLDIDLQPGRYKCAYGDWNVINEKGRHVSESTYFYVDSEGAHVVKKDELPPLNILLESVENYVAPAQGEEICGDSSFVFIDGMRYCLFEESFHYDSDTCKECRPITSGNDVCENCEFGEKLYRKISI